VRVSVLPLLSTPRTKILSNFDEVILVTQSASAIVRDREELAWVPRLDFFMASDDH
jgi:hypothetical protein